ncbi:MAG TPA: SOS response-associated peptidase [Steroidobacteraceae bacterium]|nr:SOS response-associated peptidase [Steroidobacteraceae bacterium]
MCGRFAFFSPHEAVTRLFGVPDAPAVEPRYNIAPTQFVAAVREAGEPARRELAMLHWGLVPSWAKERSIGARMINARAETLAEKPSFRVAFRRRRCLVLADGYYEWQRSLGRKQPFLIRQASSEPFGMAALWERWTDRASGEELESCAIVTTAAAASVAHIHDRMPVILPPASHATWLDTRNQAVEVLEPLLQPCDPALLRCHPVSSRVNNARNQGADLIEPVDPSGPLQPGEGLGF